MVYPRKYATDEERKAARRARYASDEVYRNAQKVAVKKVYDAGGKERDRLRYPKRRDKVLEYQKEYRLRKYGLMPDGVAKILMSQENCCAICRSDNAGGRWGKWHIDHNHNTGQVRGLLCHYCNVMLGLAEDDVVRLRAAADYLEANR